jgi:hypothetical protein
LSKYNPVRTSKRTPHFTITKFNWVTLFKEIMADYAENDTKLINTKIPAHLLLKELVHIITTEL